MSRVVALARAFGVEPSYLVDSTGEAPTGGEVARVLGDDEVREIALGCASLPGREKGIVLGIVRQFEALSAHVRTDPGARPRDRSGADRQIDPRT